MIYIYLKVILLKQVRNIKGVVRMQSCYIISNEFNESDDDDNNKDFD